MKEGKHTSSCFPLFQHWLPSLHIFWGRPFGRPRRCPILWSVCFYFFASCAAKELRMLDRLMGAVLTELHYSLAGGESAKIMWFNRYKNNVSYMYIYIYMAVSHFQV